jgi:hypothetical protein
MLRGETSMSIHSSSSPGIARAREAHRSGEASCIADAKMQIAVVHALTDELERCVAFGEAVHAIREQLVHELTRLGCRAFEVAAAIEGRDGAAENSGIRRVPPLVASR